MPLGKHLAAAVVALLLCSVVARCYSPTQLLPGEHSMHSKSVVACVLLLLDQCIAAPECFSGGTLISTSRHCN